jgi:two-component system, chemotaxis family, sensor kinase CheA
MDFRARKAGTGAYCGQIRQAMDGRDATPPALDHATLMEALGSLSDSIVIYGPDHRPLFISEVHRQRFPLFCAQLDSGATIEEAMASAARRHMPDAPEEKVAAAARTLFQSYLDSKSINSRAENGTIVRTTYRLMSNGRRAGVSVDISELVKREKELESRGKELLAANTALIETQNAVRNLLDNADQGFLAIGPDLLVGSQSSAACERLLGGPPAGAAILDLLYPGQSSDGVRNMQAILTSVFLDSADSVRDLKIELLPDAFTVNGRSLKASYKFLADNGRLMLILTDVTETTRLAQEVERERQRLEMIVFAITEGDTFASLIDDYRKFLTEELPAFVDRFEAAIESGELYRKLHTHKGLLAQFSFHWSPRCLHDVETALAEGSGWTRETARAAFGSDVLLEALERDLAGLAAALGDDAPSSGGARMPANKLKAVSRTAQTILASEEGRSASPQLRKLLHSLAEVSMIDVKSMLGLHSRGVPALAARLDKAAAPVRIEGDDVCLPPDRYSAFLRSLVHVFRNAVDHGLETPEERESAGKAEEGAIVCAVRNRGEWVEIEIKDDGRGIDRAILEEKLLAAGRSQSDVSRLTLAGLVFIQGLSSRDEASDISGRGVGLAAVKHELDVLGGSVMVDSSAGEGTLFRFRFPNRQSETGWDAVPERKVAS